MRLSEDLYLCTVIFKNKKNMVQNKKQTSSKPKFAEVIIGDNAYGKSVSVDGRLEVLLVYGTS